MVLLPFGRGPFTAFKGTTMLYSKLALALLGSASVIAAGSGAFAADVASTEASATDASTVGLLVVTAPRKEVIARAVQQNAVTILNVQSAETIAKYPDFNSAEALGRLPGVSLSSDTGEGRFVNIRGIDANLNGATYGGVVLLNTYPAGVAGGGGGRAVEFDTIPTGAIDGVVLYKTLSPDREAEGLGGQIDLTPRSAKNIVKPFVEGEFGVGYEPLHRHSGPFNAAIAVGARFGFANGHLTTNADGPVNGSWISNPTPFSFVITASRRDDRRAVDDFEPSYNDFNVPPTDNSLSEVDFRRYDYNRRRFGYGGEFDFQPNDDHSYYARVDVAGYAESFHKNHLFALFDGNPTTDPSNPKVTLDTFQPAMYTADGQETHRNTVIVLGGQDRFGGLQIDYRAAYSRATYRQDYYYQTKWLGPSGLFAAYDNTTDPTHPVFNFYTDAARTTKFDPTVAAQYNNPRLTQFYENDADQEYSYALNAKFPLKLFSDSGEVKIGASVRLRTKVVTDFGAFGSATANLGNYSLPGTYGGYYNGWFSNGVIVDIPKVRTLLLAQIPALSPSYGRDFDDKENIYAGYGMYTATFGQLSVLTGVRVETTNVDYGNPLKSTSAGGTTYTIVHAKSSYTNVFPTVQLKYAFTPDLLARATYSTGISRPGFTQAGGYAAANFTTSPVSVNRGNPDLKPTTGNNFDLDLEYFLPNAGILQFGLFDKQFSNYIVLHQQRNATDPLLPAGTTGTINTYGNVDAYARGIEAAYHQKFTWLAEPFNGLGMEANVTLVNSRFLEYDSTQSATGQNEYGSLPGTSHLTWNLAAFYEHKGLQLRLSTEYVGPSLFGLSKSDKSLDTIQAERLTMDFTSSYQLTPNMNVYFNAKNLLNTPLRYNEGASNRPLQREFYDATYEAGVRVKF